MFFRAKSVIQEKTVVEPVDKAHDWLPLDPLRVHIQSIWFVVNPTVRHVKDSVYTGMMLEDQV
jgi:hypothetical protein